MRNCYLKYTMQPLEKPVFIRFKLVKIGSLQFISHLDLHRTVNRAIIRAGIPAWYSKGFNPHTKLVFATPLSVGAQSRCEYLDVRVDREIDPVTAMERLNAELASDELYFVDAYFPSTAFTDIVWSEYTIDIFNEGMTEAVADAVNELFSRPEILMMKRSKAGDKEVNIIPYIKRLEAKYEDERLVINTVLSANSQNYLNPEFIVNAIRRELGVLPEDITKNLYSIMRTSVLCEDGETPFR